MRHEENHMSYAVKEVHYTLQGEGARTGRAAVFCRFTGCNLWSGREQDRATAQCRFCDTDFIGTDGHGGGTFDSAEKLAKTIADYWPGNDAGIATAKPYVVFTGGEPHRPAWTGFASALRRGPRKFKPPATS
jgi:organic radical activating enzyme